MKKKNWSVLYSLPLILVVYVPLLLLIFEYHSFPLIEFSRLKYFSAILLLLCGGLLMVWAYRTLLKDGAGVADFYVQTDTLVTGGPYQYIRNPLSMGMVVMLFGESLYFSSVPLLIFTLLVWAGMAYYVKNVEEYALANKYGQPYIEYKMDVGAWFPKHATIKKLKAK